MSRGPDVLVVGGGPAGWGNAIAAAVRGMSVVLVEPRDGPVDKACGEGLMPATVAALDRLGVEVGGQPLAGVRYTSADGSRGASGRFRKGPGRGVRRTALSEALERRAAELGVERRDGRITDVRHDATGVESTLVGTGGSDVLRTTYAVVADGLHSPLRRRLGLHRPARRGSAARYGLRRHFRVCPGVVDSDFITVLWAEDCEAYVTPLGEDVVNVAVLSTGGRPYDDWLDRFPALGPVLAGAEAATPVRGAGPLRQRASSALGGRVFLAGDAAGYVDALTGEGIGIALASAEVLAGCLADGSPRRYPARLRRVTARPRVMTELLLRATSAAALRPQLVPASERFPRTFAFFVNALA